MKRFTLLSVLCIMAVFFIATGIQAQTKTLGDAVTVLDASKASDNLPAIISNAGENRGAGFNGQYAFVASRTSGNHVYYWDVNDPANVEELDLPGTLPGTFTLSDMTVVGDHIFVSNMAFAGGTFIVYYWDGVEDTPATLIEYAEAPARLGDAFTVIGDPAVEAVLVASGHGTSDFYVWTIVEGSLENADPVIYDFELGGGANFGRATETPDGYILLSGPGLGLTVLAEDANDEMEVAFEHLPGENFYFPNWLMYPHVFHFNNKRFLAYMNINDTGTNRLYILDINDGADDLEALQNLPNISFEDRVVYSADLGDVANANASVSLDIAFAENGDLHLLAYAAGNGFIVKSFEASQVMGLPFVENFKPEEEDADWTWLPTAWLNIDADEDQDSWFWSWRENDGGDIETFMISYSWMPGEGEDDPDIALTPDNWLITPAIALDHPGDEEIVELLFLISPTSGNPNFRPERYEVLISETDADPDSFTLLWEETFDADGPAWDWEARKLDLSAYAGETVYIAFRHYGTSDRDAVALRSVELKVVELIDDTSIGDITPSANAISVFPNPATERFTITSESNLKEIVISDITGRTVRSLNAEGFEMNINTSGLNNGIYLIRVKTEAGISINKLQIQR